MALKRPQGFFLVFLSALILLTVYTTRLTTDISAFFIAGDNAEELLLANEIQSGALSRRIILSIASTQNRPVSPVFSNELILRLKAIPGIVDVWKANETRGIVKALEQLYLSYGAQLYSRYPERDLDGMLSEQRLNERAKALKQALLSPHSQLIKKVAKADPLLLVFNGFKSYQALATAQNKALDYENLLIETEISGMEAAAQSQIQQQIHRIFSDLAQQSAWQSERYQAYMTGVPIFAAATQNLLESDIALISAVSTVVLAILFFYLFRSLSIFFWISCLLLAVFASTILLVNLIFGSIHAMTLAVGSTLVGVCVDYPIHALVHTQAVSANQRFAAVKKIWPSLLIGAITTSVGYFALGFSGYPGFQQVAVYAGAGILFSLLLTRYVLPFLIAGVPIHSNPLTFTRVWLRFCRRFRAVILAGLSIIFILSLTQLNALQWLQDLQQLTPELDYLKNNDQKIRSRMIGIEPGRFVLISADDTEAALENAERVYQVLDQVKQQGNLSDYFGLYPWLLSTKQQQQNAQMLKTKLNDKVLRDWRKALVNQGLSVEQLGDLIVTPEKTLTATQVLASPAGRLIANQLVIGNKQTIVIIWLGEHHPEILQKALQNIPRTQYFSQRDLLNKMAISYQQRAEKMLLAGFLFIVGLLSWRYKSLGKALLTLTPALIALAIILAILAISAEPLSFLHLVAFLLVLSICDDFAIFYQENPGGNLTLTYQAIAASMLTSVLGFACLLVAQTSLLRTLAEMVTSGVLLGFLLCPVVIKPGGQFDEAF